MGARWRTPTAAVRLASALCVVFTLCALYAPPGAARAAERPDGVSDDNATDPFSAWLEALPPCPSDRTTCIPLALHVVVEDGQPVQTAAWLTVQLEEANRTYASVGTGFEVRSVEPAPASHGHVATRADRDAVGAAVDASPLPVPVYLVAQLDDVDREGEQIRGVHWRRGEQGGSPSWIIISRIAPPIVLAHELGHRFGLKHSRAAVSIMNKTPRAEPDPATWGFTRGEQRRLRREIRRAGKGGR